MKARAVNLKKEGFDIYCGRGSKWGNPYSHSIYSKATYIVKTRVEAIKKYRDWILGQPELLAALGELRGKRLGCYCKPMSCHCDILAEMVNKLYEPDI